MRARTARPLAVLSQTTRHENRTYINGSAVVPERPSIEHTDLVELHVALRFDAEQLDFECVLADFIRANPPGNLGISLRAGFRHDLLSLLALGQCQAGRQLERDFLAGQRVAL